MSKSRQWIIIFFAVAFVGIAGFMLFNFLVDPVGYFAVERKATEIDANGYTRAAKSKYMKAHGDEYDAVVIGDSKAGVLSTELLSEYTGKRYYNFYMAYGCFADFLTYTKYLIEETDIDEITLHLSSIEVEKYSRQNTNEIFAVPAVVNGSWSDILLENLHFLFRNVTSGLSYLRTGNTEKERGMDSLADGERNYSYAYGLMEEDPEGYVDSYVMKSYAGRLSSLFGENEPSTPAIKKNLRAMKKIKKLCEENGITLKVVIGLSFLSEMYKFEGEAYYDYLRELVQITDLWDFGGFAAPNLNPYNFVNYGHYNNAVGDLMIRTMYGEEQLEGFGIWLTQDNIEEYIANRRAEYERLKAEYEETGTVALYGAEDASRIGYDSENGE